MKIAVIDGTGDYNDAKYHASMRNSFCRQLCDHLSGDARYERGPSDEGYRIAERGQRAADFLLAAKKATPNVKIALAGYSRGGSAVIIAAEILERSKTQVDAMFLLDPVARHLTRGGEIIPASVRQVWTARRSTDPALVAKYDNTIGPKIGGSRFIAHNPMRAFFGATGLSYCGTGTSTTRNFRGSHGALGGVGWKHVVEDVDCQLQVAAWMNLAFREAGLTATIQSYGPSTTA